MDVRNNRNDKANRIRSHDINENSLMSYRSVCIFIAHPRTVNDSTVLFQLIGIIKENDGRFHRKLSHAPTKLSAHYHYISSPAKNRQTNIKQTNVYKNSIIKSKWWHFFPSFKYH